ncbi:DUF397 domain-containing protein [Sphaerisporangium sp. B11E5]|uniref:DUF397 domain-containing protein n=1 Tax=Sphaerisporangium sp. B11E5 TaxID=3153563 RepID=UPI00325EE336
MNPRNPLWRKSSRSGANDNCVEVAHLPSGNRAVRDSKNPTGPTLKVSSAQWQTFTAGIKADEMR